MNPLCVLASLVAAACFTLATVTQHHATATAPAAANGLVLAWRVASHPWWLAGVVLGLLGIVAQALALATGALVVVQLLLVTGLLMVLPAAALLERRRPRGLEWAWGLCVVAGLCAFLVGSHPRVGRDVAPPSALVAGVAGCGVAVVGAVALARFTHARYRALLLGFAGGIGFGVAGALLKQVVGQVERHAGAPVGSGTWIAGLASLGPASLGLFAHWPLYALLASSAAGVVVTQASYRAGVLAASQPANTIAEPLAAALLGALAFGERLDTSLGALCLQAVGVVAMVAGSVGLAHSAQESSAPPAEPPPPAPPPPTTLVPAVSAPVPPAPSQPQEEPCSEPAPPRPVSQDLPPGSQRPPVRRQRAQA